VLYNFGVGRFIKVVYNVMLVGGGGKVELSCYIICERPLARMTIMYAMTCV